jgi:putative SOS response-associated peptidase YedK
MTLKRAASGVTIRRLKRLESARARSLRLPLLALQLRTMCGRITQKSNPQILGLGIVTLVEARLDVAPRYNGAPSHDLWVIRQHPETGERTLDRLRWGLIPYWNEELRPKVQPINATAERVASAPMFRAAYAKRRCLVPIDNFFEWRAVHGAKAKQPYAIGMKSGQPFALAGIWEAWRHPQTAEVLRTFCIITCPANRLLAHIHDRMPVILPPEAYDRWLSNVEPDPRDLLAPYPAEPMIMWPISTRVNKPDNDDLAILEPSAV